MTFEECEAIRERVQRGGALMGILPVDRVRAMESAYRQLGEEGHEEAWHSLALYHLDQNGLEYSPGEAALCAARAVVAGSFDARDALTRALPGARGSGEEVACQAFAALRESNAPYLVGLMTYHGFGCQADAKASRAYHEEAAGSGNADAMFELSVLLAQHDPVRALDWCRKAAELENSRACYNLGAYYATGRGVPQDEGLARKWYERAAAAGHGRASATLGVMTLETDAEAAEGWFERAEELGFDVDEFREELGV